MSPMPPIYLPSTFTPYFYCRWRALLLLCAIGKYILYAITVMIVFCSIPKPVPNATIYPLSTFPLYPYGRWRALLLLCDR